MREWERHLLANQERHLAELLDFLRIPSVSGEGVHRADVDRAGRWVARRLSQAGLEHVRYDYPVVYGDWLHAPGKPTVLIYGHFDVEPAGELRRWSGQPFEPRVEGGRIFARGASDDKGNMLIPILAVEALLRTDGALPVNVRFVLEGQEEIGSPDLPRWIAANRQQLACDLVVSADGGQWGEDQPALTLGCRGLSSFNLSVRGPAKDLHSGVYGGTIQNPIHALVRILDSLRNADGTVAVNGFYDGVQAEHQKAPTDFCEHAYAAELGVDELFGEAGYTTLERSWLRPTLEVHGIWGGSPAAIVPAEARAAVTCRLVPGQEPARILDLIEQHVTKQAPQGVRTHVERLPGTARPYRIPGAHPANRAAADVLTEVYGKAPITVMMGATIPVCALFRDLLGADTLLFGFGLDDENIHGPDEFFRLVSWERGKRAYCRLLERLVTPW
ncbi:MAG TPA: dipeptidase [Symbiobacteriaceae bacterium]|nr:dipeptidase [Symbiobacteriaceae bacterium]